MEFSKNDVNGASYSPFSSSVVNTFLLRKFKRNINGICVILKDLYNGREWECTLLLLEKCKNTNVEEQKRYKSFLEKKLFEKTKDDDAFDEDWYHDMMNPFNNEKKLEKKKKLECMSLLEQCDNTHVEEIKTFLEKIIEKQQH